MKKFQHHDRRVRRTQKLIRKAFLQLITEKEYNQITVTDIINEADYNRATFYRHYYDKEDFVQELIDNQIDMFIDSFMNPYKYENVIDLANLEVKHIVIFDHILEHKDFYSLWDKLIKIPGFTKRYQNAIEIIFNEKIFVTRSLEEGVDKELYRQFYGHGLLGIIFNWISSGFEKPPSYMAEQLTIILKLKPGRSMLYSEISKHR